MRPSDPTLTAPHEETAAPHLSAEDEAFLAELLRPLTPEEEEDQSEHVLALGQDAAGAR